MTGHAPPWPRLIPSTAIEAQDPAMVGGKAAPLARLSALGIPTLPGVIVPTTVLARALLDVPGQAQMTPAAIAAHLRVIPLDPTWEAELVEAGARLGPRLAVRSSGVAEDGAIHAHAGQLTTVLDVAPHQLPDAVRSVWASRHSHQALAYGDPAPLAVLIQPMVEAAVSGVLFTVDPVTGHDRRMVVEAVYGMGEPLMSGQATPQSFVLSRAGRWRGPLGRLKRRLDVRVVQAHHVPQPVWWPPGAASLQPTSPEQAVGRTLSHHQLRVLGRLGLKIEAALGTPRDIEWCLDAQGVVTILQARPITTGVPRRDTEPLWTRRFFGERWPEPATPMGWSLLEPVLSWFIAYPDTQQRLLDGGPALRLEQGRPYVNATVFRHLIFKAPGAVPPGFMLEMLPPHEADAWRHAGVSAPDLRVLASLLWESTRERRWQRFAANPFTNPASWRAFRERLARVLEDPPPTTANDAITRVHLLLDLTRTYIGIHVSSLLFANLSWQSLKGALAATLPGRAEALHAALATSPPGNMTLVTNQALWRLAQQATASDLGRLARGEPARPPFAGPLADFLAQHGHRAEASWEVFSPRWADAPAQLVPWLTLLAQQPAPTSTTEPAFQQACDTLVAEAPLAALPTLLGLVWYTRRYLLLRENQRYAFDRLLADLQRTLLVLGGTLTADGCLDTPDDIAFVTWDEVRRRAPDQDLRARVAARREEHAAWAGQMPPVTLTPTPTPSDPSHLRGRGVSPGRAAGRACVLHHAHEAGRLEPGDVLVTHALDPSWTPAMRVVSAVVLELGGALSHGAVVAREYGVPMVVDVDNAVRRIPPGVTLTVDGDRGRVWVATED